MSNHPDIHNKLLFLDATSPHIRVGIWQDSKWLAYATQDGLALKAIYQLVTQCLKSSKLSLHDIDGFIHNEGPGSQLGIRLCSMAIRTWQALPQWAPSPVFSYRSTTLAKALINQTDQAPYHLLVDYRQNQWIFVHHDCNEISFINPQELAAIEGKVYHLRQRKAWANAPSNAIPITLDCESCPQVFNTNNLLSKTARANIFTPQPTTYKQWTPSRHVKT